MRGRRSLAALLILFAGVAKPAPAPARHILLITIDTLRADALSCYRAQTPGTPAIDALAGDSVVFRQARSAAPWTLPALASAMTGLSPQVHLATGLGDRVPDRLTTIAEALRRAGYRTAALVSSPLLSRAAHFDPGFQEYTAFPGETGTKPADPDQLAGLASGWLRRQGKGKSFLWVHFYDPHMPYEPPAVYLKGMPKGMAPRLTLPEYLAIRLRRRDPSPAEREWIRQLYKAEVRWVDAAVGSLIAELKRSGRYEDTLIVLLSDHGEEFWEHGGIGHGHTLYEELLRVPWLVKLPGESRRGGTDAPVSTASLAATILDLAGKPLPARYPAAPSLAPLLRGGTVSPGPGPLLSTGLQRVEEQEAILFGGFKLIRWETSGRQELYDLARDPAETANLATSAPEKAAEGARLLDRLDADSERARKSLGIRRERVPVDPEAMKRLRALGYGQ